MLSVLLLLLPAAPGFPPALPQDPPAPEVSLEELSPAEAAAALKSALKGKEANLALTALEQYGRIPDKAVTRAAADGLAHKESEVRLAAITALRFNPDPSALGQLLKAKKSKAILEDTKLAEQYYLALGQKQSTKALPVLTDNLRITARGDLVTRARVLSLGRIRDKKSVEALISLMNSGRGRAGNPHMREIRGSLVRLTGVDHGGNSQEWNSWWGDHKAKLKISLEPWPLPQGMDRQWRMLWATPEEKAAAQEKREQGRDDSGG